MSKDGGSAFPEICTDNERTPRGDVLSNTYSYGGMTLRDYFAAKALAGLLGYVSADDFENGAIKLRAADIYAEGAYALADAMLDAREKP